MSRNSLFSLSFVAIMAALFVMACNSAPAPAPIVVNPVVVTVEVEKVVTVQVEKIVTVEVEKPAPATEEPAPAATEEPAPAETEEPAPAATEEPAPAETEEPAPAATEEPAPTETEEPAAAEAEKAPALTIAAPAPTGLHIVNGHILALEATYEITKVHERYDGEDKDTGEPIITPFPFTYTLVLESFGHDPLPNDAGNQMEIYGVLSIYNAQNTQVFTGAVEPQLMQKIRDLKGTESFLDMVARNKVDLVIANLTGKPQTVNAAFAIEDTEDPAEGDLLIGVDAEVNPVQGVFKGNTFWGLTYNGTHEEIADATWNLVFGELLFKK